MIQDPIENTLLLLSVQARCELTSQCAPRHSIWPWSHTPWQEHCFRRTPPPSWPKGCVFGRRWRSSCLPQLTLWQWCAHKARSSATFPTFTEPYLFPRLWVVDMELVLLRTSGSADVCTWGPYCFVIPSLKYQTFCSEQPLTSICMHATLLCPERSLPSALCLPHC